MATHIEVVGLGVRPGVSAWGYRAYEDGQVIGRGSGVRYGPRYGRRARAAAAMEAMDQALTWLEREGIREATIGTSDFQAYADLTRQEPLPAHHPKAYRVLVDKVGSLLQRTRSHLAMETLPDKPPEVLASRELVSCLREIQAEQTSLPLETVPSDGGSAATHTEAGSPPSAQRQTASPHR